MSLIHLNLPGRGIEGEGEAEAEAEAEVDVQAEAEGEAEAEIEVEVEGQGEERLMQWRVDHPRRREGQGEGRRGGKGRVESYTTMYTLRCSISYIISYHIITHSEI